MQHVWSTYLGQGHLRHGSDQSSSLQHARYMDELYPPDVRPPSPSSNPHFLMDPAYPPAPPPFNTIGPSSGNTPNHSVKDVSLTVNYLPSKFSAPHLIKRRAKGNIGVPKQGGGREAFRAGESRMPGVADEDYDGIIPIPHGMIRSRLRWNRFKWVLAGANSLLTIYSILGLIFCILTWFNVWKNADIIRVGNKPELILSTLAASVGVFTSLIGWSGILLNNRAFLAVYNLFLWFTFAFLLIPGYYSYRHRTFNLEGKLNAQWSRDLGTFGRLRIQNELDCCGYFNPFVEATVSQSCYSRVILPGCKGPFLKFQRKALARWYAVVFGLVPFHIGIMVAALLCANHITYRFGKGMMPKAYRLSLGSMAVIMDNYASQLAEQYGSEVAANVLARSRTGLPPSVGTTSAASTSNLGLDTYPYPYTQYTPYTSEQGLLPQQQGMHHQGMHHQGMHHQDYSCPNYPAQMDDYPQRI